MKSMKEKVDCPYCGEVMSNPSGFCWICKSCADKYKCDKCKGTGGDGYYAGGSDHWDDCETCGGTGYIGYMFKNG